MDFFKIESQIDFFKVRKIAYAVSLGLIVISIASLATRGLNFGIEFRGGVVIEAGFPETVELEPIRAALEADGIERSIVQHFGSSREVSIQLLASENEDLAATRANIMRILRTIDAGAELQRAEFVSAQVGQELAEAGGMATLFALLMILAYVSFRFQWKFSVGAVAALVHDVILTVGFFSIIQLTVDLAVLAAVLAVIGYSLNDTIVIFDRIRENMLKMRRKTTEEVINASLNQTLSRTIMTGVTTLLVLVALYVLGGEAIAGFSIALIVGVLVGTYSSIYIASETALALKVTPTDLLPPQPDKDEESGVMP
ncbi:protein translocase subunit SecF [Thioalkalivibrio sp. XN279]|uniref:protein translocase subunit SecF n=1 Tax=Thioalkalivibrio sp. XN279 TaxID=2714953 RepID=UPI001409734B|nr:protein translocase subunit SecF [Thioalkalivibrio sp. XN279]NHA15636.1 protein translocase subunit SecF [Thioalkalivibrio sp. XN279]